MPPDAILFIRHAEEPDGEFICGVTEQGDPDPYSLSPRGWQRAGALAAWLARKDAEAEGVKLRPAAIFAHGTGEKERSRRSMQTAKPLADALGNGKKNGADFVTKYQPDEEDKLIADVLERTGTVLIAWKHEAIPALAARIPEAPQLPNLWGEDVYNRLWLLKRTGKGWAFTDLPQKLLAGD